MTIGINLMEFENINTDQIKKLTDKKLLDECRRSEIFTGWGQLAELMKRFKRKLCKQFGTGKKRSSAWKDAEREVAKCLGGERVSRGSDFGKEDVDVRHTIFSIEVKERKHVPTFFKEILAQADRYNDGKKLSIGVLHEMGTFHKDDIVLIRLGEFADWYGK